MPLVDGECPNCGHVLHTDDLLKGECVTGGCGASLIDDLADEELIDFDD